MTFETPLNVAIIAQAGRLGYQALLCVASIRLFHSANQVRVFVCIPNKSDLWRGDPAVSDPDLMQSFARYGCELAYFDNLDFGSRYPHSNKFYSILALPESEPFVFIDSDGILVAPIQPESLNFRRPAFQPASASWPKPNRGSHSISEIWRGLYDFFGLDASTYLDPKQREDSFQYYPYYWAGAIYYAQAGTFGRTILDMALRLWRERPAVLAGQPLTPWLDQIILPLVLARLHIPRAAKPDPIRKFLYHYHTPALLLVHNKMAVECVAELEQDGRLMSTLKHDKGFGFFFSEEGRRLVDAVYGEFRKSGQKGNSALKQLFRQRLPVMR